MNYKRRFILLSDLHIPYQDDIAVNSAIDFIKEKQPDVVVLNGDIVDFYDLSRFNKDPDRVQCLQQEINEVQNVFKRIRKAVPEASIYFVKGNHEKRLETYLMKNPELYSLDALKLPNLLGLEKYGIEFVERELRLGSLKIVHGDVVRKFSAYTAKAEIEKHDCSGISSHTHRGGVYYQATPERYLLWAESFCLCDLNPHYVDYPNWQQGLLYGWVKGESFAVSPVPIVDGKVMIAD